MATTGSAPSPKVMLVAALALAAAGCQSRRLAEETPPCLRCHGGAGSPAPPTSVLGYTETTERAVGAHRRHLEANADAVRAPVACDECHVVPTRIEGHFGDRGSAATVTFGGALAGGRPATTWNTATGRCENVYCHGSTLEGGDAKSPLWTQVDGTQRTCGSCHGFPPASHSAFAEAWNCHACHPGTVLERASVAAPAVIDVAGGKHIDGTLDSSVAGGCNACHLAPPSTGAHLAHVNPSSPAGLFYGSLAVSADVSPGGGTRYEFGCGHCHPLDVAAHLSDQGGDGRADVVLTPPATPVAGDLVKSRNAPDAAWDPVTRTCSGVYCHSSGQETPVWADRDGDGLPDPTPSWDSPPGVLGCGGCHANPPQYASGGAGSATANSHVDLDDFGWEFGHFAGMPGVAHNPKHGGGDAGTWGTGQAASPITCQACHFETVDPANVRPGGFFYLDTSGDYALDGVGDLTRFDVSSWKATQCSTCHDGTRAPVGGGAVLPLRHVNGRRDVAFDRRAALPAGYPTGLPALATTDPVRPYYVTTNVFQTGLLALAPADCGTNPLPSCGVAADVELRPPAAGTAQVITMTLEHASYDPATKTCSSVACHLERQHSVDIDREGTPPLPPLRWGAPYALNASPTVCTGCHLR